MTGEGLTQKLLLVLGEVGGSGGALHTGGNENNYMLTSATASDQGTHAFLHVRIFEFEGIPPVTFLHNKFVDQPALFMFTGIIQQLLDRLRQFFSVLRAPAIFTTVLVRVR